MTVYAIVFALGAVAGGIGIGILANRRPGWFAHVVTMANHIDDKVNTNLAPVIAKAADKAGL